MTEPDVNQILNLGAIIREVNGDNKLGAAALAEAILSHPKYQVNELIDKIRDLQQYQPYIGEDLEVECFPDMERSTGGGWVFVEDLDEILDGKLII